jgi:hypothetical protein
METSIMLTSIMMIGLYKINPLIGENKVWAIFGWDQLVNPSLV